MLKGGFGLFGLTALNVNKINENNYFSNSLHLILIACDPLVHIFLNPLIFLSFPSSIKRSIPSPKILGYRFRIVQ